MLREASAVFMNGFVLDELSVDLVLSAVRIAREAGTAVFFDPGPRCWTLLEQPRRHALDSLLDQSSVVLMTQVMILMKALRYEKLGDSVWLDPRLFNSVQNTCLQF